MNERQKISSLKYLLNEMVDEKKIKIRYENNVKRQVYLDQDSIGSMLTSGFFNVNESNALSILFSKTGTRHLNESSMRSLDKTVTKIVETNEVDMVLLEGFFGDIWDGLKKMGDKAKDAILGGWGKVKAIWGEFKEIIQELVNNVRGGMEKLFDNGKNMAMGEYNKLKTKATETVNAAFSKLDDVNEKKKLADDLGDAYETGQWVGSKFKGIVTGAQAKWFTDTLAGKGTPEEPVKVNPDQVDAGFDELKKEESVVSLKSLVKERNELFSNSKVLKELYESSKRRLNEGAGAAHLEDVIKNPVLKKIVGYGVNLLQWAMIPVAKLAQKLGTMVGQEILKKISEGVKFFGGPGIFGFVVIGAIFGEILEIYIKGKTADLSPAKLGVNLIKYLVPGLGPMIKIAETLLLALKTFLLIYTVGTILLNLVLLARKVYTDKEKEKQSGGEEGGEPEVQTAGYKPKGQFKMKEGKLIFIS